MTVNDATVSEEPVAEEVQEAQEPESMDAIIEKEAEAELSEERGEDEKEQSSGAEPESDEGDEVSPEQQDSEEEPEEVQEVEEDEEEAEPIDTSSFAEVGLEAVPDDYKPENWKSFLKDAVDVIRGEVNQESRAQSEQQEAFQSEVSKVDEGWQNEISELQKAGALPKNDKELEAETKKVFEYMAETNQKNADNANKQIWSFETAYKLMQANDVTSERKAEIANRRKTRAGAASASGNSEGGSGIPRPTGESMDDIIARELNL